MEMLAAAVLAQQAQLRLNLNLPGLVALISGILILVYPRFLNYIVAVYLILVGLISLFDVGV